MKFFLKIFLLLCLFFFSSGQAENVCKIKMSFDLPAIYSGIGNLTIAFKQPIQDIHSKWTTMDVKNLGPEACCEKAVQLAQKEEQSLFQKLDLSSEEYQDARYVQWVFLGKKTRNHGHVNSQTETCKQGMSLPKKFSKKCLVKYSNVYTELYSKDSESCRKIKESVKQYLLSLVD